jgi:2-polyprenyl-6-methoxyphenol hydroxylase-like FAD-dependent oxidoreductase
MLLATLYENLKNKDKVITGAKVQTINTLLGGVEVVTADGQVFNGDLLVGADGVYSAVRQEMWRLVEETHTQSFPKKDWDGKWSKFHIDDYGDITER